MTSQDKHLCFLNLVSRGNSIPDARKKSGYYETSEPEQELEPAKEAPAVDQLEAVKARLKKLGVRIHPQAKLETLQRKLEEAELM